MSFDMVVARILTGFIVLLGIGMLAAVGPWERFISFLGFTVAVVAVMSYIWMP